MKSVTSDTVMCRRAVLQAFSGSLVATAMSQSSWCKPPQQPPRTDLGLVIYHYAWTMPMTNWNTVPPGRRIYWRVRGRDLNHSPPKIVTSEVRSFFRQ